VTEGTGRRRIEGKGIEIGFGLLQPHLTDSLLSGVTGDEWADR